MRFYCNTILNKTIINIPISVFQFYSLRYNNPININLSILKKQSLLLKQNLTSIIKNHLHTNLTSFTSDFRRHLKIFRENINKINEYIRSNSLIPYKNKELTCITNTPESIIKKKKPSFYPRYTLSFNFQLIYLIMCYIYFFYRDNVQKIINNTNFNNIKILK